MGKRTVFILFLISVFISSCSPQCNQWKLAVIKADSTAARYVKAYLPACNTFNGVETVLISCNGNKFLYLYAFTLLFPFNSEDEEHCDVLVTVKDTKYLFTADRLQGGQCLLLPNVAMQLIIDSLLEHTCIEIKTGRYQSTLTHENFDKTYEIL